MKIKCPKCSVQFIIPSDEYNGINRCELCRFEFIPSRQKDDSQKFTDILNQLNFMDENNRFYSKQMLINHEKIIDQLEEIKLKLDYFKNRFN